MESIKISDNEIQITKQGEAPAPIIISYKYDFLIAQKAKIIADANNYLQARQKELAEVNTLLTECEKLGITAKVIPQPLI